MSLNHWICLKSIRKSKKENSKSRINYKYSICLSNIWCCLKISLIQSQEFTRTISSVLTLYKHALKIPKSWHCRMSFAESRVSRLSYQWNLCLQRFIGCKRNVINIAIGIWLKHILAEEEGPSIGVLNSSIRRNRSGIKG